MELNRLITWDIDLYNDNSSFHRATYELYNLTDNAVRATSGAAACIGWTCNQLCACQPFCEFHYDRSGCWRPASVKGS